MNTKNEITPNVFEKIEADYKKALSERREIILRQEKEGWKQQEIATYWKLDISRVNRIIKGYVKKG